MKKAVLIITIALLSSTGALAQKINNKLPTELVNFFQGNWNGEGEFASGKKISASVTYNLSLDSCWLMGAHTDKAPNKYKAILMWGTDRNTGKFLAYNFDNFQGHRVFESDGYKNETLVLTNSQNPNKTYEHFIYKKLSDSSFKMTYEISRDSISWKMSDYLIFTKTQ